MSRSFWKADKPAPEPGQVWRRKRNGRLVTVIDPAARIGGNFVDVSYDMGKGSVGYSSSLYWHSTFERADESPFAYLRSLSSLHLRKLADECEAIIAVRAEDGVMS